MRPLDQLTRAFQNERAQTDKDVVFVMSYTAVCEDTHGRFTNTTVTRVFGTVRALERHVSGMTRSERRDSTVDVMAVEE